MNEQDFRQVMAQWASGVSVVTTHGAAGMTGVTASSFISVSLRPPLVAVSLGTNLFTHDVIRASGVFAVNILASNQSDFGKIFAGLYPENADRFAGIDVERKVTGSPILPGVMGWIDCSLWQAYPGGDHTIFVGEVVAASAQNPDAALNPLLYFRRQWGSFHSTE